MTRIKICGVTCAADAVGAAEAGADAVGFVFAPSPRRIAPADAAAIARELPPFVARDGVFVDAPAADVRALADAVPLDWVQLHGTEPAAACRWLPGRVVRRIAVGANDTRATLGARLREHPAAAFLLDPGAGGGLPFNWEIARGLGLPLILAGGLRPDNVAAALRACRPWAVDVSTGVERTPGRKDLEAVRAFVAAVRREDARRTA